MSTTETTPVEGQETDPAQGTEDPAAEVARLREELAKARKWEDRAKANAAAAKELETFKQQSMSETEQASAKAFAEGRAATMREYGTRLVESEVRVAAAGRNFDVDTFLEGFNSARFMDDDGNPDVKAINAYIDKVAPRSTDDNRVPPGRPGPRTPTNSTGTPAEEFGKFLTSQLQR